LPAAKVNDVKEAFESDQAKARGMIEEMECDVAKSGKVRLVGAFASPSISPDSCG